MEFGILVKALSWAYAVEYTLAATSLLIVASKVVSYVVIGFKKTPLAAPYDKAPFPI